MRLPEGTRIRGRVYISRNQIVTGIIVDEARERNVNHWRGYDSLYRIVVDGGEGLVGSSALILVDEAEVIPPEEAV